MAAPANGTPRGELNLLWISALIVAGCSLTYELLLSTVSTYLLGSGVLHFSVTIGLFMSFMGVGSYLSRYFDQRLLTSFIYIESWLGFLGGFAAAGLYAAFTWTASYYLVAILWIGTLGTLIGLELPLLTRISQRYGTLKVRLAQVLSLDYIGALVASLLFPLVLLPYLGTVQTGFATGLLNTTVALVNFFWFRKRIHRPLLQLGVILLHVALLILGWSYAGPLTRFFERGLYRYEVVYARQTPYQKLILTRWQDDLRLYLNGGLQFSSRDEYRYHEALVHIPAAIAAHRGEVLVLGGGDGLAVRELLRYPELEHVDVVDLDPAVTELAREFPLLRTLNQAALHDPRVALHHEDAFRYVRTCPRQYDLILADLPDPNDPALSRMYTRAFYHMINNLLTPGGVFVTQATSPFLAREAVWCIHRTISEVFPAVQPYHLHVPSFGEWGFVLASRSPPQQLRVRRDRLAAASHSGDVFPRGLRFLAPELLPGLWYFPPDMDSVAVEVNTLNTQRLVRYYEQSWFRWQ